MVLMIIKAALPIALKREFDYLVPENLKDKICPGIRVKIPFGYRQLTGFVTKIETDYRKPRNINLKEIDSVIDETPYFDGKLMPLAKFISSAWGTPLGLVLSAIVPDYIKPNPLPPLTKEGAESPLEKVALATPSLEKGGKKMALRKKEKNDSSPPLSREELALLQKPGNERQQIINTFLTAIKKKESKTFLLFHDAVTKIKDLYFDILGQILEKKQQGLLLAPDIGSAMFLAEKMKNIFPAGNFAIWHSKISRSERTRIYEKLSCRESLVVLGTRSACLLPFKNLAAVVVDNEHDDMYKQEENKPYYHAKDVLEFRSKQDNFPLIFASRTPSLETLQRAIDKKIEFIRFKNPQEQIKPQVMITSKYGRNNNFFSDELLKKLQQTFDRKMRALVILNRKGVEKSYTCLNCGRLCKCSKCFATAGDKEGKPFCHVCKSGSFIAAECPQCKNRIFKLTGYGIKKIKQELEKIFPTIKIMEFSANALNIKSKYTCADLIIGTRLLSREYELEKIGCVAFADADTESSLPDYKSSEKTAHTIFQAAGYLKEKEAALVIQTSAKNNLVFSSIAGCDYFDFAFRELELRKKLKYPPYCRLIRIIVTAKEIKSLEKNIKKIAASVKKTALKAGFKYEEDFEILGPSPCGFRAAGKTLRHHLIIKYFKDSFLALFWQAAAVVKVKKPSAVKFTADPADFY
jgi:primosomal protein N' (replication factor Y)